VVRNCPVLASPFVVIVRETGGAVKYLLLICGDESAAAHADEGCGGWTEDLAERGMLQLTGGPFAETKEQIAGLAIIECEGLDQAIEAATAHPAAGYGTIEIRQLWLL
jgi:hypothetical protein